MSNKELVFYCTDFSPIEKDGKPNFRFKLLDDNGKETKINDGKKPNGLSATIIEYAKSGDDSDKKRTELLKNVLNRIQQNIDLLLVDKNIEDEEKQVYSYFKQQIYIGGLVGVVSIKDFSLTNNTQNVVDITVQINTRFDDPDLSKDVSENGLKPYFLMSMLLKGYTPLSNSTVRESKEKLTDLLLLYAFANKFKEAYVKGFFRAYQRFEKNDSRVKGSIDVTRHIKLNAGLNNGKVAYSYREKTEANYVNALVVEAYKHLKQKYYKETQRVFDKNLELRQALESLTYLTSTLNLPRKNIIMKNRNAIFHPYYTEYEDLRSVCLKVLRDEKISVFDGNKSERVEGILTYVPKLWEQFIEDYLRSMTVKAQDKQHIFGVEGNIRYNQLTIPDYVFYKDDNIPFMVLDAKFKPGWLEVATGEKTLSEKGLLADYDKCIRDMVTINAHATGVIFPTSESITCNEDAFEYLEKSYVYKHNISQYNTTDSFYTFPVFVPAIEGEFENIEGGFEKWRGELNKNCQSVFEKIKGSLEAKN